MIAIVPSDFLASEKVSRLTLPATNANSAVALQKVTLMLLQEPFGMTTVSRMGLVNMYPVVRK